MDLARTVTYLLQSQAATLTQSRCHHDHHLLRFLSFKERIHKLTFSSISSLRQDGYEEELWSWALVDGRRGVARVNVSLDVHPGTRLGSVALKAAGDIMAPALHASRAPPAAAADPAHALRPMAVATVLLDYLQVRLSQSHMSTENVIGTERSTTWTLTKLPPL